MPFLLRATKTAFGPPLDVRLPELEYIAERLDQISDTPEWIPNSVRAYVLLSMEVLKLQHKLEKTGHYLLSSEREAYERVYSQGNVIGSYYLAGLLLTQALWPTHFRMSTAFREVFLRRLPSAVRIIEIGVGTGYHLRRLFEHSPGATYQGVDISPFSVEFARRFAFGTDASVSASFALQNATTGLSYEDAVFDAAICGEVLEHVEDPRGLLREIRRVLKPNAPFFMTTAIFAANIDHIYLFENAEQVREVIRDAGWQLEEEWVIPVYEGPSEASARPMSYASLLRSA
jgi:ubiquinone/menaquinone biosynthesis C-methylase UbiE